MTDTESVVPVRSNPDARRHAVVGLGDFFVAKLAMPKRDGPPIFRPRDGLEPATAFRALVPLSLNPAPETSAVSTSAAVMTGSMEEAAGTSLIAAHRKRSITLQRKRTSCLSFARSHLAFESFYLTILSLFVAIRSSEIPIC